MNRSENVERWQRVADGDVDDELMRWLQVRAAEIVKADAEPAGARPDALVRAAGLAYRGDPWVHVRRAVEIVREFDLGDGEGKHVEARRGQSTRIDIDVARAAEPSWAGYTDDEIRKRLSRLFARKR